MRQTNCARTTEKTACNTQSKESETNCVISQERDRTLKKKTNKKNIKIVATDHKMRVDLWNLVTTCGMGLRLEILFAGASVSHQSVVNQCFKGNENILHIALETRPFLYNG